VAERERKTESEGESQRVGARESRERVGDTESRDTERQRDRDRVCYLPPWRCTHTTPKWSTSPHNPPKCGDLFPTRPPEVRRGTQRLAK
jgi:hypothetical protein